MATVKEAILMALKEAALPLSEKEIVEAGCGWLNEMNTASALRKLLAEGIVSREKQLNAKTLKMHFVYKLK